MPYARRCFVCHRYLDPYTDEAYELVKGKGSRPNNLHRVLWLTKLRDREFAVNPWQKR